MTFELLRIEFRRNRLAAAGAAAAFVVTLPVCRLVASVTGMELNLAVEAALTGWLVAGLPLAACMIGAASGSAAAARDAVDAESVLPLSPGRRAAAAVANAVFLTALFAVFLAAASRLLGLAPQAVLSERAKNWGQSFWYSLDLAPLVLLAALDALAGAWALSRLLGNGAAGGLLGLLLTGVTGFATAIALGLEIEHHWWGVSASAAAYAVAVAGVAAKLLACAVASRWRERRPGPGALWLALALLFAPPAAAWLPAYSELSALSIRLRLKDPAPVHFYQSTDDPFPRGARALASAGDGVLLETVRGGLVSAAPGRVRWAIPERESGLSDLLYRSFEVSVHGVHRDAEGRVWIERYVSPHMELWRLEDGKAESRAYGPNDYGSFGMVAGAPAKFQYPDGRKMIVASAADYFDRGDRASWSDGREKFVDRRLNETRPAIVRCGGRCLKDGDRTWTLPGRALSDNPVFGDQIGGRREYLVPLRGDDGRRRVVVCRPGGKVETAWPFRRVPRGWPTYEGLPDGTLFAFGPESTLWWLGPDGARGGPISFARLRAELPGDGGEFPEVVRLADGKAWLVWRGSLSVIDDQGRTVLTRPLPPGIEDARALKDGFLVASDRGTWLADWSGTLTRLEKPAP